MTESRELLAQYANTGSEAAFGELVRRYINLVYSTALRLLGGDTQLAEDVTQTVFIRLATMSKTLATEVMLGGWLHQNAFHVATTVARSEWRRKAREREASEMSMLQNNSDAGLHDATLLLDEAITQLPSEDRTAILLRFFEQRDFRSVGKAMGTSEDSARMRVNRAVDKLHGLLKQRGVTMSAAALGTALAAEAVTAAPEGLAATVAGTVLAKLATGGGGIPFLKSMTNSNLKLAIVGGTAVAVLSVSLVIQHQSSIELRTENRALHEQAAQLAPLAEENQRLSNLVVQANTRLATAEEQTLELARLRGEAGRLRLQTNDLARALAAARQTSGGQRVAAYAKRIFPNTTMSAFAHFIGGVLQAPVADQTGLTGTYYIAMTPPSAGGASGRVERVSGILLNELGLQLSSNAADGSYALKIDHPDAFGLQAGLGKLDARANGGSTLEGLPQDTPQKLMLIDTAKRQWAIEKNKQNTDTPVWQDLQPYLDKRPNGNMGDFTNAPEGNYIIGTLGRYPRFQASP